MAIEQLDIEVKEDSAEKLAAVAGQPTKRYIFGIDFNKVKDKVMQLVDFCNGHVTTLENALHSTFPSTKAVADAVALKSDKAAGAQLEITADTNQNNLDPQGKGCLSIINPITITGIKTTGFIDGQEVRVFNGSTDTVTLSHMSNSSLVGNKIFIQSTKDLPLKPNSFVLLRFSSVRNRLELINVMGTGFEPDLANDGEELKVMMVGPDGQIFTESIIDALVYDDTTTVGYASLAALVAKYPTANGHQRGFTVVCRLMTPPTEYRKESDNDEMWTQIQRTLKT